MARSGSGSRCLGASRSAYRRRSNSLTSKNQRHSAKSMVRSVNDGFVIDDVQKRAVNFQCRRLAEQLNLKNELVGFGAVFDFAANPKQGPGPHDDVNSTLQIRVRIQR